MSESRARPRIVGQELTVAGVEVRRPDMLGARLLLALDPERKQLSADASSWIRIWREQSRQAPNAA